MNLGRLGGAGCSAGIIKPARAILDTLIRTLPYTTRLSQCRCPETAQVGSIIGWTEWRSGLVPLFHTNSTDSLCCGLVAVGGCGASWPPGTEAPGGHCRSSSCLSGRE